MRSRAARNRSSRRVCARPIGRPSRRLLSSRRRGLVASGRGRSSARYCPHSQGVLQEGHRLSGPSSRPAPGQSSSRSRHRCLTRPDRSQVRGQGSEVRGQGSGVRGQGSGVRGQRSGVGGRRSGVRGQRSEVKHYGSEVRGQRFRVTG